MNFVSIGETVPNVLKYIDMDAAVVDVSDCGIDVYVLYKNPDAFEVAQFEPGCPVKVKLLRLKDVILFLFKIGDLKWFSVPYSVHLSRNLDTLERVEGGNGYAMRIMLIDSHTAKLVKLRLTVLPTKESNILYELVSEQENMDFDPFEYSRNVENILRAYTTKQLIKFAR